MQMMSIKHTGKASGRPKHDSGQEGLWTSLRSPLKAAYWCVNLPTAKVDRSAEWSTHWQESQLAGLSSVNHGSQKSCWHSKWTDL